MSLVQLEAQPPRKPSWLRVKMPSGATYFELKRLVRENRLHTVCEEAMCPNIGECWNQRSATFMIESSRICSAVLELFFCHKMCNVKQQGL